MVALLPPELLQTVNRQYPCRKSQIEQLATLYNVSQNSWILSYMLIRQGAFPHPRILVAYGLEQTSKYGIVTAILQARSLKHAIVKCRECLSQRHLLTKIFAACLTTLGEDEEAEQYDRIDSINSLAVCLENLARKTQEKVILVLDGIDRQRGASATLLPSLARLGDLVGVLLLGRPDC